MDLRGGQKRPFNKLLHYISLVSVKLMPVMPVIALARYELIFCHRQILGHRLTVKA